MTKARFSSLAIALALGVGCGGEGGETSPADAAIANGERVYLNVCIACHHGDPSKDGALGPAIAGSSLELLKARVLRGEYPPGYTPKRADSAAMPVFEYLADDIEDLHAYLNQTGG